MDSRTSRLMCFSGWGDKREVYSTPHPHAGTARLCRPTILHSDLIPQFLLRPHRGTPSFVEAGVQLGLAEVIDHVVVHDVVTIVDVMQVAYVAIVVDCTLLGKCGSREIEEFRH
jgi:hypothetical protein